MTSTLTIATWRERIGATNDFPLHAPTDVERAMVAEIADLRVQLARHGQGEPVANAGQQNAAARDMLAERRRQVEQEGWTPAHDDGYIEAELAKAAAAYTLNTCTEDGSHYWPWPRDWWKPVNARRDLVKAGALILAEIERMDRAEAWIYQKEPTYG